MEHSPPQGRKPVITASRVVQFRRGPLVRFLDQFRLDEPLERSVQRRRPQPHLSGSALQDLLHDSVAVLLPTRKRQHDMEPLCLKWKKTLKILLGHRGIYIYHTIYI